MGADGHVLTIAIEDIPPQFEKFLGEPYHFVGWSKKELHGSKPFLWAYWDTNGADSVAWSIAAKYEEYSKEIEFEKIGKHSPISAKIFIEALDKQLPDKELAKEAWEFSIYLEANAEDWQVWT